MAEILSNLESNSKGVSSIQAKFKQTKKLTIFTRKIVIEGIISIKKPNHFSWHVYKPVKYGLVVKGDQISQWNSDTNQIQSISMKNNPVFNAIFRQMGGWLSGNYKSLMNDYKVAVKGEDPLILKFEPLESAVSYKFIKNITIFFDRDPRYIKKFVIVEKNEDRTILTFYDTKLNLQISKSQWNPKF